MADVANRLIKILIKIHRISCSPMPPGFPPLYSHVTPKSVPETQNPPNRSTFPQTKSVHLRSRFEIAIKPPQQTNKPPSQTNKPRNIYTQTHFSWNSREKKSRETCYCSEISISVRQRPNTQVLVLFLCMSLYIASFILCVGDHVAFVYNVQVLTLLYLFSYF